VFRKLWCTLMLGLLAAMLVLPAGMAGAAGTTAAPEDEASAVQTSAALQSAIAGHAQGFFLKALAEKGYIDGIADGMASPDEVITRGQAAIVLQRVLGLEAPEAQRGFADLEADGVEALAVYALKEKGVVRGYGDVYRPEAALTREQMASLLARAFGLHDNGIRHGFRDYDEIGAAHRVDAERMKQHFILEGTAFEPKRAVTRAEFAVAVYRALNLGVTPEGAIPLEDFFRLPAQVLFLPSPDGQKLAWLQPWNNRLNLYVRKAGEAEAIRVTSETERDILAFAWANNDVLIYPMDSGGDENYHLLAVNADGSRVRDLTPFPNTTITLIDPLKNVPDEILIGLNKRDPRLFDVYRLNVETGEIALVAENPGNITDWMTDHEGKLRIAISSDGYASALLYRETEEEPFVPLLSTDPGDTFNPIMFTFDNRQLYALSNIGRDKAAIVRFDPQTRETVETVYEHPEVDVYGMLVDGKNRKILAVLYETDKFHYHFMDESFAQVYQTLKSKLSGKEVDPVALSGDRWIVLAYSDKSAGTYYYYNTKSGELELLAEVMPWLDEGKLADMKPISFRARDGLTIHGYLTLPKGVEPRNLPVVVNPHGGPWARDSWGFNPEVQFLASRGYAVLQINFRGSTGYGKAFLDAGNKQWGRAMQDDITDGVQWLIEQGIADPRRVAIYGGSYGGYATLAGLTFTPDLYAAGVDYVGPSNLFTLLDSLPPYWDTILGLFYERVGHPEKDKELLTAVSPLFHVDRIKAPLFVAQGANDPRVKQQESDQIVRALAERGIDVPYMLKENEGHGFVSFENQLDFYRAMEKFLHRHLMEPFQQQQP